MTTIRTILSTMGIMIIGAVMVSSTGYAQDSCGMGKGKGMGRGKHAKHGKHEMGDAIEKLNLTADQKARIQAIRDRFKTTNAAALEEIKALHAKMREYAQAKDRDNMRATREQIKAKMEALKPARQRMHEEILAVLTPEQRQQLDEKKLERKGKHKERGEKGKGKGKKDRGEKGRESQGNADLD